MTGRQHDLVTPKLSTMSKNAGVPGRHRRRTVSESIGRLATTAIVAYGTYRLADWARDAWLRGQGEAQHEPFSSGGTQERTPGQALDNRSSRQQRQSQWRLRCQRVQRCRIETKQALNDLLPTLRRSLEELTDTTEETRALKQLRAERRQKDGEAIDGQNRLEEERELWDTVKVKTMTRMISAAYAHTIVFLALTVQVHIIGGMLFEDQSTSSVSSKRRMGTLSSPMDTRSDERSASDRIGSYQLSHRLVLTHTYEYFFDRGIATLVRTVERAVSDVLYEWDVMGPSAVNVSLEKLEDAIFQIRDIVECRKRPVRSRSRGSQSRRMLQRSLTRFLLPPEYSLNNQTMDDLAQTILDETWDILESPPFEDSQNDCLDMTFGMMKVHHWSNIFTDSNGSAATSQMPLWTNRPLAKVISQLRHTTNSFFDETPVSSGNREEQPSQKGSNFYVPHLEKLPTVLELSDVSFG